MVALIEQPNALEPAPQPLSTEEKVRLHQLELEIERNLTGFIKCGRALLSIREERLWRGCSANFSEYCRERFALARSTADQLCRSTQVFETLNVCLAGSETPVPATVPEIVLRPLTTLPSPELQAQTWRLAATLSPNGQPTRTISARVTRMVKEVLTPPEPATEPKPEKDVEQPFLRPVTRLANWRNFDAAFIISHIGKLPSAWTAYTVCDTMIQRCKAVQQCLSERFPELKSPQ